MPVRPTPSTELIPRNHGAARAFQLEASRGSSTLKKIGAADRGVFVMIRDPAVVRPDGSVATDGEEKHLSARQRKERWREVGVGAQILRDLGIKPGQLHMATFDLVPVVLDEMKKGYVDLTIDQQPYYQGYIPIMQLAMIKKYGLSAFDVNTGKALVEPKDVDQVMKFVEMGVR